MLRPVAVLRVLAVAALLVSAPACRRHRASQAPTTADASIAYGLGSGDDGARREAAEKLRDNGGPPADAVPHLLKAIRRESDPDTLGEMLETLGASGAAEARPVLEAHLNHPEKDVRSGAEKGLSRWSKKTGQTLSPALGNIARLENPDWEVRRDAADDLADHNGPPPDAVAPLIAAASKESHPKALGAMLLTLGASGAPEAKAIIETNTQSTSSDVRRYAGKAFKKWRTKNGQAVRKDVETAPPPATTAVAKAGSSAAPAEAPPAQGPDGCQQFKDICGADPFSLDKCRAELKPLAYGQQVAWADCVNASSERCQKAHDTCVVKAKSAPP